MRGDDHDFCCGIVIGQSFLAAHPQKQDQVSEPQFIAKRLKPFHLHTDAVFVPAWVAADDHKIMVTAGDHTLFLHVRDCPDQCFNAL